MLTRVRMDYPVLRMILMDAPPAEHQPEKGGDDGGPTYHSRTRTFPILSIRITMHRICRRCFRSHNRENHPSCFWTSSVHAEAPRPAADLSVASARDVSALCCFLVTHSAMPTTQEHPRPPQRTQWSTTSLSPSSASFSRAGATY